jgi:RPN1 N-terminal domain
LVGPTERDSLKFKLAALQDYALLTSPVDAPPVDHFRPWGHEFVRSIAGEIGLEYNHRVLQEQADPTADAPFADLLAMVHHIVPFHIQHNAEAEAIDLLMELQRLKLLLTLRKTATDASSDAVPVVDANNYQRIALYLIKAADYMADPDDFTVGASRNWMGAATHHYVFLSRSRLLSLSL